MEKRIHIFHLGQRNREHCQTDTCGAIHESVRRVAHPSTNLHNLASLNALGVDDWRSLYLLLSRCPTLTRSSTHLPKGSVYRSRWRVLARVQLNSGRWLLVLHRFGIAFLIPSDPKPNSRFVARLSWIGRDVLLIVMDARPIFWAVPTRNYLPTPKGRLDCCRPFLYQQVERVVVCLACMHLPFLPVSTSIRKKTCLIKQHRYYPLSSKPN